jgi:hypothetical protein
VTFVLSGSGAPSDAAAVIRSVVVTRSRRCYQRGLSEDARQRGKLAVEMKVDAGGLVAAATVTSNRGLSASVAGCVVGAARQAKFETTTAGFSVTVALEMSIQPAAPSDADP